MSSAMCILVFSACEPSFSWPLIQLKANPVQSGLSEIHQCVSQLSRATFLTRDQLGCPHPNIQPSPIPNYDPVPVKPVNGARSSVHQPPVADASATGAPSVAAIIASELSTSSDYCPPVNLATPPNLFVWSAHPALPMPCPAPLTSFSSLSCPLASQVRF